MGRGASQEHEADGACSHSEDEHEVAAIQPQFVAEHSGEQHGDAAKERKQCAAAGCLAAGEPDILNKIGGSPEVEGLAQECGSQREQTH